MCTVVSDEALDQQYTIHHNTRKCGNYSDVLPLKAARHYSIWSFKSELQANPMPYHLASQWCTSARH